MLGDAPTKTALHSQQERPEADEAVLPGHNHSPLRRTQGTAAQRGCPKRTRGTGLREQDAGEATNQGRVGHRRRVRGWGRSVFKQPGRSRNASAQPCIAGAWLRSGRIRYAAGRRANLGAPRRGATTAPFPSEGTAAAAYRPTSPGRVGDVHRTAGVCLTGAMLVSRPTGARSEESGAGCTTARREGRMGSVFAVGRNGEDVRGGGTTCLRMQRASITASAPSIPVNSSTIRLRKLAPSSC